MATLKMLNMAGAEAGEIKLNDEIFAITPNEYAVHEVVKNYLACQRQGTQSAKTRAEVRGGGRKPFRQKGTGRHRQGSSTDPTQVGGGVVFAPKPRDYRYRVNKKVKRLAMKSVLSAKVADNEMIVLNEIKFDEPKTKEMIKNIFVDETGGLNVVEIVVLIGVAVLLAIVFKNQIAGVLETLFGKINGTAGGAVENTPVPPNN